ncbi:fructosamine kinase family protein [Salinispira pacifica]|uniref:Ribulosamine/erythrulosamine 3-kinase potentially involved in protein deglycation n=1 Tax=Salinispira pacifica TaxID=1307761 RepID=V5WK05_9SPIO|nr:fructosamine kinase family protein [Salinispira pacifica]AHC16068.1 Ribulosamine/erythrulosamine 3-kinase potentially involved in protein deglycation [Salinispira pacifica]
MSISGLNELSQGLDEGLRFSSLNEALKTISNSAVSDSGECSSRDLHGGCINRALILSHSSLPPLVYKYQSRAEPSLFRSEALGLLALKAAAREAGCSSLRIPEVYGVMDTGILIAYIEPGRPSPEQTLEFGAELATLHSLDLYSLFSGSHSQEGGYGFFRDNYIGLSPQSNGAEADWVDFFRTRRLGSQLELAGRAGYADAALEKRMKQLMNRLGDFLPRRPKASMLHGDLWSGNYLFSSRGEGVLIDPAVYAGHNEADLAMTELFGGFPSSFYRGYREVLPVDREYHTRRDLYNLYHMLNHLNLFGGGYRSSVLGILSSLGF